MEIPTESLLAFMAYARAIDAEDRGHYTEAIDGYQQALQYDPKFTLAKQHMLRVDRVSRGMRARPRLEMYFRMMRTRTASRRQLQAIGLRVYAGYLSSLQARKALQELNSEEGFGSTKVRVEIPLPPP
jgi:tetratricopeptide (TPR) repeat protein